MSYKAASQVVQSGAAGGKADSSPENPGNPLIPEPGWNAKFSPFVVRRRLVNN